MIQQYGAYGLIFAGPPVGPEWWNPAPDDWTPWRIEWSEDRSAETPQQFVGPDRARLRMFPSGFVEIDRINAVTTRFGPRGPDIGLVHPYCTSSASLNALWQGWESFHAGGFVLGGLVWALLGERESGKSSALAWIQASGAAVFADDLVVVCDGKALAGPRCLDLREEAARRFRLGEDLGVVGMRERWRVHLPPVASEAPLGGFVVLQWGPGPPSVRRAYTEEKLKALVANRALLVPRRNALSWLKLLSTPAYVFQRPQEWSSMDTAMSQLIDCLEAAGGGDCAHR